MQKIIDRLEALHSKRKQVFDKRTEDWQVSEKGEKYDFHNNSIEGIFQDLKQANTELEDLLEDYDCCPASAELDDFKFHGIEPDHG